ncbi:hypothetical protein LB105_003982 [Salmonella enterica]|uniref:hypothetical protein n=1 Tax=Salmonella enterica TaxID=28901 RepID=UPI001C38F6A8|nr:hypothetical protein [Salmonella enterica]EID3014080.1 hypothetical protein [Salmonella enterica]WGI49541.1 hypothetical protein QBX66_24085 [Salmonella enterica subsp. diarizonae serovar 48:i:z]
MKDIDDIRRDNIRLLEAELGGPTEAANRVGMSPAQFSNLKKGAKDSKTGRPRGMHKNTARRIEKAAGKPAGWLDIDHSIGHHIEESPYQNISELFAKARPEQQAVAHFFLLRGNDENPEWVDGDARAYADSLESKARRWLSEDRTQREPKKIKA